MLPIMELPALAFVRPNGAGAALTLTPTGNACLSARR